MSITVTISAIQSHMPDVTQMRCRTVVVNSRWYRSLWASTTLAVESPTDLFVASHWLERSSCIFMCHQCGFISMCWYVFLCILIFTFFYFSSSFYSFYFHGIFYGSCGLMQIKMTMIRSHFARIQSSRSQYFTSTNHLSCVFISIFTAGLLQKLPCINHTSSVPAVTSHAAVNSDARSIQISSQNIRIRS